jgi:hypothetical protein
MMTRSESLSKALELGLRLNSPDNVKSAKFILDYRKDFVEDGETVHYGMIQLYVETDDRIFTLDYLDFWDWYKNEESKCDFLKSLIENENYISVWKSVDLEKGEWKEDVYHKLCEQKESAELTIGKNDKAFWDHFDYKDSAWYVKEEWLNEFPNLKKLLKQWEDCVMVDKPLSVEDVKLSVYFEDIGNDDSGPLFFGMVYARIKTGGLFVDQDILGNCESYHDEHSKKVATEKLMLDLEDYMEWEMEDRGYKNFWNYVDLEKAIADKHIELINNDL